MAFFIVGLANQMSIYLVPNVLNEYVQAGKTSISLIAIVIPSLTVILTAPLWGSYLSGRTPMLARGTFSLMQVWTFSLYAYGGLAGVVWPFYIGSFIHACSIAGGSINWLTGNLYFARPEHTALYNGIHVFMTGIRGCLAPFIARIIYVEGTTGLGFVGWNWGPWIFLISVVLSAIGAAMFFYSQRQEAQVGTENSAQLR